MPAVPLDRPPRPPAGAITERVRRAILRAAERLGVWPITLADVHCESEHLGHVTDLANDVEERYQLATGSIAQLVAAQSMISNPAAAELLLLKLPDTEFLTVLEHAADHGYRNSHFSAGQIEGLVTAADGALQAHGAPYRREGRDWRFEWVGDPLQHELTVQPALLALADARLVGAQDEFEEARRKRRRGTPKELEAAIGKAASAVESVLQVVHHELGVTPPRSQQVTPLFNSLVAANVLPGYVDKLVAATAGPRNNMASHGQGGTVREVPEELADASIASAATAITFLAHYLP